MPRACRAAPIRPREVYYQEVLAEINSLRDKGGDKAVETG